MSVQGRSVYETTRTASGIARVVRLTPTGACAFAWIVGAAVLIGWLVVNPGSTALPTFFRMNPTAAVALLIASLSLWLLRTPNAKGWPVRLGRGLAVAVACIGAIALVGYVAGWNGGVDTVLFAGKLALPSGGWQSRLAPNTAFECMCIGLSLALLDVKTRRQTRPAEILAHVAILIALLAAIGYAYGARPMYAVSGFPPMAPHTAWAFLGLGVGILCARPDNGIVRIVMSDSQGGALARWMLPAVFVLPIVIGWLRLAGQRAGFYDTVTGTELHVTATIVILTALVWAAAAVLERADGERSQAEEELRRSRATFESLFEYLPGPYLVLTPELKIVTANAAYLKATMTRREDLRGRDLFDAFPDNPADLAATGTSNLRASLDRVRQNLSADTMAIQKYDVRGPDGAFVERYWSPINSPVLGADGRIEYILHRVEDVTEFVLKRAEAAESDADLRARMERLEAEVFQSSQAVQAANQRLQAVNKELESFSYSVSHDLRSPLRHIDGFADLLDRQAGSGMNADARRYLGKIRDGARRMGVLIDELLVFSKMGRKEVRMSRISLRSTVDDVIAELNDSAAGRAIEWRVGPLPEVEADGPMLHQVFANLLGNAVKYTGTRPRAVIEVGSMDSERNEVVVFVRDNGVGFDMQYADKLFGVFQRLHRADEFEGVGIGLANVRRIIDRHGGRTWAKSQVDHGATFYVSLPIRAEVKAWVS
jgi:signal transduction histidine kinase